METERRSCTLAVLLEVVVKEIKWLNVGFENVGCPIPGGLQAISCTKVLQAELGVWLWHLFRLALQ